MQTANWGVPFEPQLDISPRNALDFDSPATGIEKHYQLRLESIMAVDEMIEALGECMHAMPAQGGVASWTEGKRALG